MCFSSCWLNLPDHIFGDTMMMFSPESMEDLQKSRQVCQSWNVMMAQRTRMEKHTIRRKAELRADRIRMMWEYFCHHTYLPDIATASSLAHNKILGSVTDLFLYNLDLASVHSEHLASLAACVTRDVEIINVCNLSPLLNNIKCECLVIENQSLSSEETRSVVRAMESCLTLVMLWGEVSLDIEELTQYSGSGKCRRMEIDRDTDEKYGKEMETWMKRINPRNSDGENNLDYFCIFYNI